MTRGQGPPTQVVGTLRDRASPDEAGGAAKTMLRRQTAAAETCKGIQTRRRRGWRRVGLTAANPSITAMVNLQVVVSGIMFSAFGIAMLSPLQPFYSQGGGVSD